MSWHGRRGRSRYGGFAPYVSVGKKLANAERDAKKLAKQQGRELSPVKIEGRIIAKTYWGKAWCENLERYSDYANRLPRGKTYARNGSIVDLQIKNGKIEAIVAGSETYTVTISIETLSQAKWTRIKNDCSRSITSLLDLLQGRFDVGVMERLTHPTDGLFPHPKEIKMRCSCPDAAGLCKHLAAVFYGVGNRLDNSPEMLFTLRNVDHLDLVNQAIAEGNLDSTLGASDNTLAGSDLSEMFGIELDASVTTPKKPARVTKSAATKTKVAASAKSQTKASKAVAKTPQKAPPPKVAATTKTPKKAAAKPKTTAAAKAKSSTSTKTPGKTKAATAKATSKTKTTKAKPTTKTVKTRGNSASRSNKVR